MDVGTGQRDLRIYIWWSSLWMKTKRHKKPNKQQKNNPTLVKHSLFLVYTRKYEDKMGKACVWHSMLVGSCFSSTACWVHLCFSGMAWWVDSCFIPEVNCGHLSPLCTQCHQTNPFKRSAWANVFQGNSRLLHILQLVLFIPASVYEVQHCILLSY